MAIRTIVEKGDQALEKKCRTVEKFDSRLHELIDDMAETMYAADGVGLAAPQVGVLRRVVTIDIGDNLYELVNPEIVKREGEQNEIEGCLSVPGVFVLTKRPEKVTVKAQDRDGKPLKIEAEGFLARAMCHELDHLDGILMLERGRVLSQDELKEYMADGEKDD